MNEEIIQNLNERLDRAIDKGKDILVEEGLSERIDDVKHQTEQIIKKHPIISIVSAAAIGFVLARIFRTDN